VRVKICIVLMVLGVLSVVAGVGLKVWESQTAPDKLRAALTEEFAKNFRGTLSVRYVSLSPSLTLRAGAIRAYPPGVDMPVFIARSLTTQFDRGLFLSGQMVPRRMVIVGPRVFLRYDPDRGQWNAERLLREEADLDPDEAAAQLPLELLADGLMIEKGSVSLNTEGLYPDGRPWIISGIAMAAVPGPSGPDRWTLSGSIRQGHFAGTVLSGWVDTGEEPGFCLNGSSGNLRVTKEFVNDIPSFGQDVWELLQPTGSFAATVTVGQAGQDGPLSYAARLEPKGVRALTEFFPGAVTAIVGTVDICGDELVFRNIKGVIEPKELGFTKEDELPIGVHVSGAYNIMTDAVTAEIEATNVILCRKSVEAIPFGGAQAWEALRPSGHAEISLRVHDVPGKPTLVRGVLRLNDAKFAPPSFPAPLTALTGTVELSGSKLCFRDVEGVITPESLGLKPEEYHPVNVAMHGALDTESGAMRLDIEASDVPVCQMLIEAIPDAGKGVWEELRPGGLVDLSLRVTVPAAGKEPTYRATIRLDGASVKAKKLPVELENLTGEIDLRPDFVHFRNVTAIIPQNNGPAHVTLDGTSDLSLSKRKLQLALKNLKLNEEIVRWLPGFGEDLLRGLKPEGYADGVLMLSGDAEKPVASGEVKIRSGKITARFLPVPVDRLAGTIHFDAENVQFSGFSGRLILAAEGEDDAGGFEYFKFNGAYDTSSQKGQCQIDMPTLTLGENLVKGLPSVGRRLWEEMRPEGVAAVTAKVVYNEKKDPAVSFFADLHLRNAKVCWERFPVPLQSVSGHVALTEEMAVMPAVSGQIAGGWFDGAWIVRHATKEQPMKYSGRAEFRRVDLPRLLKEKTGKDHKVAGYLSGVVEFSGADGPKRSLSGAGTLDLSEGFLWSMPVLMDVVEVLHLGLPGSDDRLDVANMRFGLESDYVEVKGIQIISRGTELTGKGRIAWDGTLDMAAVAATLPKGGIPIIGPAWRFIMRPVEKELVKLSVKGTLDKPEVKLGVLAPLGRPVGSLYDLISSPFRSDEEDED